ncbi:SDR family oxidoreductase [Streptomyces cavourensis]|uniref:SDR family NAD(P)-dependent oxidoreductase n=1 Tax=Streptomyces cavourensis TaxID=67258 RepID=A0AAD0VHE2_9ACTN|nr:SDR family oxidoreductase [Streptomyces cavourensis]AXI74887.1 SDR family NAD(P)-dependent oxidoreductase [Streptomyces cavourensis]
MIAVAETTGLPAALVAGASSGIGAAVARRLAARGHAVALVGRREAELNEVAESIRTGGGTALPLALDLAEPGAPAEAVAATAAALGSVGVLVCSAGAIRLAAIHETEERHWERQVRVNLTVPFLLAREVLPGMRERRHGWIVNIGSGVGSEVVPGSGGYGVSKHAVERLTELVHEENRDLGIRAVTVAPGWVATRLAARPAELGVPEDEVLDAEDIADTVAWLLDRPARMSVGPLVRVEPTASRAAAGDAMTRHLTRARAEGAGPIAKESR